ncbi:gene transfer agent family protein [Acuticoccus sp. M5D2P5]|uniref:gene transfer agent family protein n=1 Tax=Acuticoccus kalidii TaxID=2910977 RepID=UPI001F1D174D|nr:gene transfer agent family protein [Acuticoccus kalidii]MCF3934457.1 gene transfer agent family protein [Acuticoccus kalidii]
MANRYRGEVSAVLDGRTWTLCLTLGALAELERAFQVDDMTALVERFADGRLSARDATKIIGAGLRGGGNTVADDEVARMSADGGATGFATVVASLLTATFGGETAGTSGTVGEGGRDPS